MTGTTENVLLTFDYQDVDVAMVIEDKKWPITILHEINHSSPFTNIINVDENYILDHNFEIFIYFQGNYFIKPEMMEDLYEV